MDPQDYILTNAANPVLNGTVFGDVASRLVANEGDPLAMRPFVGNDGRSYVLKNVNDEIKAIPTLNAATLRHEEWLQIDEAVLKVSRERLMAVEDLRSRGLTYNIPNGMGKTVLLTETQSDVNDAVVDLDGLAESPNDRPVYGTNYLPLPIIHKDFHFSSRQILASRNGSTPLDTSMIEMSTRKVAEMAEKLLLGTATWGTYATGTVYGYTNFTSVLTQTLTSPTASGWAGTTLLSEVLAMKQSAQNAYHYGPYMLYNAPSWDQYLDGEFKTQSDKSLRSRLREISGIEDVKTLDFLSNYDLVMVQMTSDVVREVIGMDIQAIQWETKGGMQVNFKVMAILVPQVRADYNGNTGIVYGSV